MWNELLQDIARRSAREGSLPNASPDLLREVWPALVGESIAHMSSPLRLEDQTLFIEARDVVLVEEWKRSPLALLRRLRRFSPWPIETLEITHNPRAGSDDNDRQTSRTAPDSPAAEPTASADEQARRSGVADEMNRSIDPELRSILEQIDRHRRDQD